MSRLAPPSSRPAPRPRPAAGRLASAPLASAPLASAPLASSLLGLSLLTSALLSPAEVLAEDELESGRVIAVEPRPFRMVHEFAAQMGVLPLDALYTGFSLGGSYTLHLSDLWAWEAIDFHYSANVSTGLDVTLAERWSVAPTNNPEVQYLLASHFVFSPLYGKFALFNHSILYVESYLALGGGVARFSDGFRPEVSAGPGVRLYFGPRVSTRLDVRSSLVPDIPSGLDHVLKVTLGIAFNFGNLRATESASSEPEDTTTGFETLDELFPTSNPARAKERRSDEEKTGS